MYERETMSQKNMKSEYLQEQLSLTLANGSTVNTVSKSKCHR